MSSKKRTSFEKWVKKHREGDKPTGERKISREAVKRIDEGESSAIFDIDEKGQKTFAGARLGDGTLILRERKKKKKKDLW